MQTPDPKEAGRLFGEWLSRNNLSASAGARLLGGCSHVAVLNWSAGDVPEPEFREAIEKLTSGAVPAAQWGLTKREARLVAATADVQPFAPPPRAA